MTRQEFVLEASVSSGVERSEAGFEAMSPSRTLNRDQRDVIKVGAEVPEVAMEAAAAAM